MKLSFAIVASLVAVVSAATTAVTTASTMKSILDDMDKIAHQFNKINDLINKFPENGAKGAASIHDHETTMHNIFMDMATTINTTLAKPVSTENVQKILTAYGAFVPTAVKATNMIATKQANFVALGGSAAATMQSDLLTGQACCAIATGSLNSITPPTLTDTLMTMVHAIEVATDNGIAAFASVAAT